MALSALNAARVIVKVPCMKQVSTTSHNHDATTSRMSEKGVEFNGGSLHDGLGGFVGFGGCGERLALHLLSLQNTVPKGNCDGSDGFGGFRSCSGFGRRLPPLNSNPPFPTS